MPVEIGFWQFLQVIIICAMENPFGQETDYTKMKKAELLRALQAEIRRFSHFAENPPSMLQGGKGVVVPGCPMCKKRINTMSQFLNYESVTSLISCQTAVINEDGAET